MFSARRLSASAKRTPGAVNMDDESRLAATQRLTPRSSANLCISPLSAEADCPSSVSDIQTHANRGRSPRPGSSSLHWLAQGPHERPVLPTVGTSFLGFRLLTILGRGAFGQVYLAQQGDLAN